MTASSPIITAITRGMKASANWSAQRDPDGQSRNASAPRKTRPAWITTRSASTTPGTGTSPCLCSPWHSWQSYGTTLKRGSGTCGQPAAPRETDTPPEDKSPRLSRPADNRNPVCLVRLSVAEIRRLLSLPFHDDDTVDLGLYWSAWRRAHQGEPRRCHFRRRLRLQVMQI